MYRTFIFFLTQSGEIHPILHARYIAVIRREEAMLPFAGQRVRLADWYVAMQDDSAVAVENETYGFLEFDVQGYACPVCDSHPAQPKFWQPTETERQNMMRLLSSPG